ncbi:hypothetical protein BaRGS_00002830 [Batillaria attramentaria]|uniref:Sphingomyelin phosphodiesterase 4 n=1 Tax=Batillaria attramentaria TaxID=370345 RepID=A0ABD0M351_9CAEN
MELFGLIEFTGLQQQQCAGGASIQNESYQIQGLQSKTLLQKCRETEDLIKRTSTKELRLVFPALLQSIFGFENEPGWGIERLSRPQHGYDFELLRSLLGPDGPVMNLVYSLQADPYTTYEFPFKFLPGPSRHTIEEGAVPVFYVNKLQTHGFAVPALALNAFELYMFHFAYALVSPHWQQTGTTWTTLYDYLYPTLVDDYLTFFLPLDRKTLPPMPHVPAPVRSPVSQAALPGRQVPRVAAYSPPRVTQRVSLFKPSFTLAQKQHSQSSPVLDNTEAETWRSETMLQIFVEFWLNQNSLMSDVPTFSHGAVEHFMPSLNQVKIVRLLVKYLHYFANSCQPLFWRPGSAIFSHGATPIDQHKRSKDPRYREPESRERNVEEKWDQFIEDNLLFYTVLFQEFVPRVYRMDLTSPQSAYMLFRVYSLPNLGVQMILRGEFLVHIKVVLALLVLWYETLCLTHLSDMEIPGFQYSPLFADRFRYIRVLQALATVTAPTSAAVSSRRSKGWFWSLFSDDEGGESGGDTRRLPQHLETAALNLCKIFSLPMPRGLPSGGETHELSGHNDSTMVEEEDDMPDCVQTEDGPQLTPLGRYQIVNNLKRFRNWQTGDPDLQPIRSYENAALVRLLYQLCLAINFHFGRQIWSIYNRPDFLGRLAKVYLAPPLSPNHRISHPCHMQQRRLFGSRGSA